MISDILPLSEFESLREAVSGCQDQTSSVLETPFVRILASSKRDLLAKLLTARQYVQGEIVVREGDSGDGLFIIWTGKVVVFKGALKTPTIIGCRGVGEIIGEMSLLSEQPRSATVVALEETRLLKLERSDFQTLLDDVPAMGRSLLNVLSGRLRLANEARSTDTLTGRKLVQQVTNLQDEKEQLLTLERLRQETTDLIVHDLRNPLGNIFTALKLVEVVLPDTILQENRQLLDIAQANIERMQRLVDDLLDVTHLEQAEIKLDLAQVDLRDLFERVAMQVKALIDINQITFTLTVPPNLPPVQADETKLERVLINLLDNAIKYTPNGGQIELAAGRSQDGLLINVTDSGRGIPAAVREQIFERFVQLDGSTSQRRGFGLGLVFCRLAVEAHGGRIWVEEAPNGMGSRFSFTLPTSS